MAYPRTVAEPPPYQVTHLEEDSVAAGDHRHVVAVGTLDPDGGHTRWSAADVIAAMSSGERFVVGGEDHGASSAVLEPSVCQSCHAPTLAVGSPGRSS